MSDLKLFRIHNDQMAELEGRAVAVEKSLQTLMENHLEALLGVRFLASEHSTGRSHGGLIDTLGLDENSSPVIIEYKRALNHNVINQGLFYLDWLLDHKGEFELMVLKQLGKDAAETIDWSNPRLLCIAGNFTKFDEHAVGQMNRNIELLRYKRFGDDLLLLELVNAVSTEPHPSHVETTSTKRPHAKTATDYLAQASQDLKDRFEALKEMLLAFGDEV